MNFLNYLKQQSQRSKILLGFALILLLGFWDYLTGYELGFSSFYVIPIALVTWSAGRNFGILASLVSACVWLWAEMAAGQHYSHPFIFVWNTLIRLTFFLIITLLQSQLKIAMDRERVLARTDSLTGAINARFFYELVQIEIHRSQRFQRSFTLAYIDLDNFKLVNDQFGHAAGDQVLRTVVKEAQKHLREIDIIARLGGDEFAVLLPETSQESAQVILSRLRHELLDAMQCHNWSVTFSIGALTCITPPPTTGELVKLADDLMYLAKRQGKNVLQCSTYWGHNLHLERDQ